VPKPPLPDVPIKIPKKIPGIPGLIFRALEAGRKGFDEVLRRKAEAEKSKGPPTRRPPGRKAEVPRPEAPPVPAQPELPAQQPAPEPIRVPTQEVRIGIERRALPASSPASSPAKGPATRRRGRLKPARAPRPARLRALALALAAAPALLAAPRGAPRVSAPNLGGAPANFQAGALNFQESLSPKRQRCRCRKPRRKKRKKCYQGQYRETATGMKLRRWDPVDCKTGKRAKRTAKQKREQRARSKEKRGKRALTAVKAALLG